MTEAIRYRPSVAVDLGHAMYVADNASGNQEKVSAIQSLEDFRTANKKLRKDSPERAYGNELLRLGTYVAAGKLRAKKEYLAGLDRENEVRGQKIRVLIEGGKFLDYAKDIGHMLMFSAGGFSGAKAVLAAVHSFLPNVDPTTFENAENWAAVAVAVGAALVGEVVRYRSHVRHIDSINMEHDEELARTRDAYRDNIIREIRLTHEKAKNAFRDCFGEEPPDEAQMEKIAGIVD